MNEEEPEGEILNILLLVVKRTVNARPGEAIRMVEIIERMIARENLDRPISRPFSIQAPPTPQRVGPCGLDDHLPPFRRRVDFFDDEEPVRPVLPPGRPHLEFDEEDYEQETNAEPEPLRLRKRVKRRVNPFIDAEAGVDGDASADEGTDNENDNLDGFIVVDDIDF